MAVIVDKIDWNSFLLTLKLASITTFLLLLFGVPLAYSLVFFKFRWKIILEVMISMPLVLPPTVLGFYLLLLFSKEGILGNFWNSFFGYQLSFHFEGLVLGSFIFSLPFMIHPLITGFRGISKELIEASYTLGKSKLYTLFHIILPNMKTSILTGIVLTFTHTIGEFGVVLMIGGNIEGETKVISISIYDLVEKLDFASAHLNAFILFLFTFFVLFIVYFFNKKIDIQ